jgi:regulator of sigma E protease
MPSVLVNILLFVVVLGVLVFVHELGHYLAAKSVKATIYEFSLGFGPKIFSKEYKGILYAIRAIPLGGFVKIAGDGDPSTEQGRKERDDTNSLKKKSKIAQAWVMCAGVIMNIFLATGIYYLVLSQSDWKASLSADFREFNPVVGEVEYEAVEKIKYDGVVDGSGAKEANIPDKGEIRSVGGEDLEYSFELGEVLEGKEEEVVEVEICVDEECDFYNIEVSEEGHLGVMVFSNYFVNLSYKNSKLLAGPGHLLNVLKLSYQKISSLFSEARETGDYSEVANTFTGPVGIYLVLDYFKQFGVISVLSIVADLSLSLAVMNILPIPALDGGRVLILIIESILKKDLDERIEAIIINISFVFLIILIIGIFIKDFFSIENIRGMFQ